MDFLKILKLLSETHVPTILVVAGIFFLFLALGGQFGAKLVTDRVKPKSAGILGAVLLLSGVAIFLSQGEGRIHGDVKMERRIQEIKREIELNESRQRETKSEIEHLRPHLEEDPDAPHEIERLNEELRLLQREKDEMERKLTGLLESR